MFEPDVPSPRTTLQAPTEGRLLGLLSVIAVVGVLYVARDVFVPVALAVLLSFVLSPVILVLRRMRLPRSLSVVSVVLVTFCVVGLLAGLLTLQVSDLAAELPSYQQTLREKIQAVRQATSGSGPLERVMDMVQDLGRELEGPPPPAGLESQAGRPVPVEVHQPAPGILGVLAVILEPLVHPLTSAGLVFIFLVFILLQREDLRNRVTRLAGAHDIQRTTAALDDAGHRLARFFLAQVALNAAFGLVVGLGLWVIGVPSPVLFGVLAAVLRFVPYVGAAIAALLPVTLALAVDPGWAMVVKTVVLFVVVEPLVGHVVEPLLYGRSTGLSPLAVLASVTFWTWLWGPIGLVLATPLTLCLVVLGRHVEHLEFLDVALGDRPPLSAPELLYQRMLAGDPLEAAGTADAFLKEGTLEDYLDRVALPALRLAERDAARGALDMVRQMRLRDTVADLIDYLPDADAVSPDAPTQDAAVVVVVAARSPLDEAAGLLLAHLCGTRGIPATALGAETGRSGLAAAIGPASGVLVVSHLWRAGPAQRRSLTRRLERLAPKARILTAYWGTEEEQDGADGPVTMTATLARLTLARPTREHAAARPPAAIAEPQAPSQA